MQKDADIFACDQCNKEAKVPTGFFYLWKAWDGTYDLCSLTCLLAWTQARMAGQEREAGQ